MTGTGVPLHPGAAVAGETGWAAGRIGAFVTNGKGELFLLTAAHILLGEASPELRCSGTRLGAFVALPATGAAYSELRYPPLFDLIAAVKLDDPAGAVTTEVDGEPVSELVSDPIDSLGSPVFKAVPSGRVPQGIVAAVGASVQLRNRFDDTVQRYDDVLEVRFGETGAEPPAVGEAGSLIVDADNRALGMLIGVADDCCLVAPLAAYLRRYDLSLFEGPSTRSAARIADLEDSLKADLVALAADIKEWRGELESEPEAEPEPQMPADIE